MRRVLVPLLVTFAGVVCLLAALAHADALDSTWTPEEIAWIDKLAVGDHFLRSGSAGDSCNTCTWDYIKTGPDTVRMSGWGQCTLLACTGRSADERYKPEEKK